MIQLTTNQARPVSTVASLLTFLVPRVRWGACATFNWFAAAACLLALTGCVGQSPPGTPDLIWGHRGFGDGRFQKPRAIAIDRQDQVYVVDMTSRIQVFNTDGKFLRSWKTPLNESGKPCGLSFDRDGTLLVADTHYFRVLMYSPAGELLESRTIGGVNGHGPGEFYFLTDVVQDSQGNYYVCEYGDFDRVQKFTREGSFVLQWGKHGSEPGEFLQPRGMVIDQQDHLYIADACNHRVQVFDVSKPEPTLVCIWGTEGKEPGQLRYPYGIELDGKGHVYIAEFGNSRVQKFTVKGDYLAHWGTPGRAPGELNQPWALARDSLGRLHIVDSYNHRIQRVRM